jgi:hypothetical protein
MEQCIDVENSQSFLRGPPGLANGPADGWVAGRDIKDAGGTSITLILSRVIAGFGGTIVILRPSVIPEKSDRNIYQSLQSPMYT